MHAALTLLISAALNVATLRHVYRGGTTLNDHAVAFVVSGCLWIYPALWWGAHQAALPEPARAALAPVLLAGAVLIYALFFILDRRVEAGPVLRAVGVLTQPAYAFSLWTGLLFVFWCPVALLAGWPFFWPGPLLLLPAALAGWGTAWTYLRHEQLRQHTLHTDGTGSLRIVQLSDLHASPLMAGKDLYRLSRKVEALQADIVFVTGDLVMPFSEEEHDDLIEALRQISAPVLCCAGNHDLPIRDRLKAELEAVGVRFLVDEQSTVEAGGMSVEVVGLDFWWQQAREKTLSLLDRLPSPGADYRVLLAHDPRYFQWIPAERFDLVLSGHTHGGQVGTNMFGVPGSVLGWLGLYDQGFFTRGGCRLYVHRGSWHTGLPPRMGIASEIAVFTVQGTAGAQEPAASA